MIGVGGRASRLVEPDLEPRHVGDVEMISVAAPDTVRAIAPICRVAARQHPNWLGMTVRTPFPEGPNVGIFSADRWRLGGGSGRKHDLRLAASDGEHRSRVCDGFGRWRLAVETARARAARLLGSGDAQYRSVAWSCGRMASSRFLAQSIVGRSPR